MTSVSGPIAIPRTPNSNQAPITSPIQSARSFRSVSSTNSPPPAIASNTLALLAKFQDDRTRQEAKLARLEAKARAQAQAAEKAKAEAEAEEEDSLAEAEAWADIERLARIEAGIESTYIGDTPSTHEEEASSSDILSVDEWRAVIKENYQQSQFWYSTPFAYHLARSIHARLESIRSKTNKTPNIAFLCSPTAFVAFQHLYHNEYKSGENSFLMEIDERFKIVSSSAYIRYDYNLPTKGLAGLQNKIDMVVIDPPYLNQPTTDRIAETARHLLVPVSEERPDGGDVLLITGDSIGPYATKTYPLPGQSHLVRTALQVEHYGGRLSNDFSGWGSWPGADAFGAGVEDEKQV